MSDDNSNSNSPPPPEKGGGYSASDGVGSAPVRHEEEPLYKWWVAGILGVLALIWMALPGTPEPVGPPPPPSITPIQAAMERIEEQSSPGRLGLTSEPHIVRDRLKTWYDDFGKRTSDALPLTEDEALLKKMLSAVAYENATAMLPRDEDIVAFRMRLLCRDIVNRLVPATSVETSHADEDPAATLVAKLFNFAVQQIAPISEKAAKSIPLTPYEALVFGQGTVDHRVWVVAELARQLRYDVILLTPKAEGRRSLIGVLGANGAIWLFDPLLGVPVPASVEPAGWTKPASLAQAKANPALLESLAVDEAPPLTADDLPDLKIRLIGDSSLWAARMAQWNDEAYVLRKNRRSTQYFEGLGDRRIIANRDEIQTLPGLLTRVVQAGQTAGWTADDVSVWDLPDQAMAAVLRAEADANSDLANRFKVLAGPREQKQVQTQIGLTSVEHPFSNPLHAVRIEQLQGSTSTLQHYVGMRGFHKKEAGKGVARNRETVEIATYFIALCQLETNKLDAALDTIAQYERDFPAGRFTAAAKRLRIQLLKLTGRKEDALKLFPDIPKDAGRFGDELLKRRWTSEP